MTATDTTRGLTDGCQDLTEHVAHLRAAYNEPVPADTYTSTRSGLAAAAEVVELLRDLPLMGVTAEPDVDNEPNVRLTFETVEGAQSAAARLNLREIDPDPADRWREWTGFADLGGAPAYVTVEHDHPASSPAADRCDRRRAIVAWTRAAVGFALMVLGGLAIAAAVVPQFGALPVAIFLLGLGVYPDDLGRPSVVGRAARAATSRVHRLARRVGAR